MRRLAFLLLALVILILPLVGCTTKTNDDGYALGFQEGYAKGFMDGVKAGSGQSPLPPGFTTPTPKPTQEPKPQPTGAINWDEAKDHIGDRATVCGPVAGTQYGATSRGKPTWLNMGKDHPSSERFVVIIWGENRGNFPQSPESYYAGKTICVTGLIQEYRGIPQIEVTSPDQIQEQ